MRVNCHTVLFVLLFAFCNPKQEFAHVVCYTGQSRIDSSEFKTNSRLSTDFVKYISLNFPNAFRRVFITGVKSISVDLVDTSCTYGVISSENRLLLLNTLPKNLSKEESDKYFKNPGFFVINDSSDAMQDDSLDNVKAEWVEAPENIAREYSYFYSLIRDWDNDYIIVLPKALLEKASM